MSRRSSYDVYRDQNRDRDRAAIDQDLREMPPRRVPSASGNGIYSVREESRSSMDAGRLYGDREPTAGVSPFARAGPPPASFGGSRFKERGGYESDGGSHSGYGAGAKSVPTFYSFRTQQQQQQQQQPADGNNGTSPASGSRPVSPMVARRIAEMEMINGNLPSSTHSAPPATATGPKAISPYTSPMSARAASPSMQARYGGYASDPRAISPLTSTFSVPPLQRRATNDGYVPSGTVSSGTRPAVTSPHSHERDYKDTGDYAREPRSESPFEASYRNDRELRERERQREREREREYYPPGNSEAESQHRYGAARAAPSRENNGYSSDAGAYRYGVRPASAATGRATENGAAHLALGHRRVSVNDIVNSFETGKPSDDGPPMSPRLYNGSFSSSEKPGNPRRNPPPRPRPTLTSVSQHVYPSRPTLLTASSDLNATADAKQETITPLNRFGAAPVSAPTQHHNDLLYHSTQRKPSEAYVPPSASSSDHPPLPPQLTSTLANPEPLSPFANMRNPLSPRIAGATPPEGLTLSPTTPTDPKRYSTIDDEPIPFSIPAKHISLNLGQTPSRSPAQQQQQSSPVSHAPPILVASATAAAGTSATVVTSALTRQQVSSDSLTFEIDAIRSKVEDLRRKFVVAKTSSSSSVALDASAAAAANAVPSQQQQQLPRLNTQIGVPGKARSATAPVPMPPPKPARRRGGAGGRPSPGSEFGGSSVGGGGRGEEERLVRVARSPTTMKDFEELSGGREWTTKVACVTSEALNRLDRDTLESSVSCLVRNLRHALGLTLDVNQMLTEAGEGGLTASTTSLVRNMSDVQVSSLSMLLRMMEQHEREQRVVLEDLTAAASVAGAGSVRGGGSPWRDDGGGTDRGRSVEVKGGGAWRAATRSPNWRG
ncbi:hypothetical protein HK101_000290 [Irineochytrium annulatum]|nr:hypothetical protein HK101_000290 [Irineochytrium annulatum]